MNDKKQREKGAALIYILIAIALLAALTATFMGSSSDQTTSQNITKAVTELGSQINLIRGAIDECVLTYPAGDSAMPAAPAMVGGESPIRPYPLMTSNTYLLNPTSAGVYWLKNIRCPGNPGNSNNHARIFGGNSGKSLPPAPSLFDEWRYFNQVDGVFFFTSTAKTDAFLKTALQKLETQFSRCEAEFIDATGGDKNLDSVGGWKCTTGRMCFRVWMKTTGTSFYPDKTGCP